MNNKIVVLEPTPEEIPFSSNSEIEALSRLILDDQKLLYNKRLTMAFPAELLQQNISSIAQLKKMTTNFVRTLLWIDIHSEAPHVAVNDQQARNFLIRFNQLITNPSTSVKSVLLSIQQLSKMINTNNLHNDKISVDTMMLYYKIICLIVNSAINNQELKLQLITTF